MGDKRQKNQLKLAFMAEDKGEARRAAKEGTESLEAERTAESPANTEQLMEEVCGRENCKQALARVKANKQLNPPNRRVRTRTHGGVTGKAGDRLPMSICPPDPATIFRA